MPKKKKEVKDTGTSVPEDKVRPSISIRMIRHAESGNNEVYRNARYIYRGGTPEFDEAGWINYVNTHRSSDPGLSEVGKKQAQKLADFLVPHLLNQASHPVRVITSPMRRTLETIRPTLKGLHEQSPNDPTLTQTMVHGFYFESEGCHTRGKVEEGMNPKQITEFLQEGQAEQEQGTTKYPSDINFVGFPDPDRGWYANATSEETRAESEMRAAKFYVWLCDHLDQELATPSPDVFDAGVALPGEETENEHDKSAPRKRRRRTTLLIGHGDFMSLILKRMVAGYGHAVENEGIPHRSAFVHFNTGITELEYFGLGRFLIMGQNHTPHFLPEDYAELRSGGSLKDGWSFLMPNDEFILYKEVEVAFEDELDDHVREQTEALKALYLSSKESDKLHADKDLSVEAPEDIGDEAENLKHFVVKHGNQVVGVATYSEQTGKLSDVAIRPSVGKEVSETLFDAVNKYARKLGRSGSIMIQNTRVGTKMSMLASLGFEEVANDQEATGYEL